MCSEFDVERSPFDLDTFQEILEAMDGYYVLPTVRTVGVSQQPVEPWDLPTMPSVSVDTWKYHFGFAVDRGFIECWTPQQMEEHVDHIGNVSQSVTLYDRDPNVSSGLRPARLTYAGKEFIDNLKNPPVRAKALEALKNLGLPFAMRIVEEAAVSGLIGS